MTTLQGKQSYDIAKRVQEKMKPVEMAESREMLNAQQEAFCQEYLKDFNGTQAAKRAGYSPNNASVTACEILSHQKIRDRIATLSAYRAALAGVETDKVILELARIGFSDIRRIFDDTGRLKHIDQIDDDTAAAIGKLKVVTKKQPSAGNPAEVEYIHEITMIDKLGALDKLARYTGALNDKAPVVNIHQNTVNVDKLSVEQREQLKSLLLEARPEPEHK